jgi:probable phosphoglycerate mutase
MRQAELGSHKSSAIRILLIRHGETEWNRIHRFQGRIDITLNQGGVDQAQALARALNNERLVAIYSSPLTRAMETARLVKVFHRVRRCNQAVSGTRCSIKDLCNREPST